MEYLFAGIVCGCVLGLVGLTLGTSKGRGSAGFFLGFFLGPIGWVITLLLPETGVRCPSCKGVVVQGATKCRHCGSDLPENLRPGASLPPCPKCGGAMARTPRVARCRKCHAEFDFSRLLEVGSLQPRASQATDVGSIRFICPSCKKKNTVTENLIGKKVLCQNCNSPCTVPKYP
jgi:hypothetical protein